MRLRSCSAVLAGLLIHYSAFYLLASPLWTETIAEWIMARTPSRFAILLLASFGEWAKPFAMTGAVALLGLAVEAAHIGSPPRPRLLAVTIRVLAIAMFLGLAFHYFSIAGQLSFWVPVTAVLVAPVEADRKPQLMSARRQTLVMLGATGFVAFETFFRNRVVAKTVADGAQLGPLPPPVNRSGFAPGLVRKAVTPVPEFYGMSKNGVDPAIDVSTWRLRLLESGKVLAEWSYPDLLKLQRSERFVTLRCISNTLNSDLMGTAHWAGIRLDQLLDRNRVPAGVQEIAFIGADGHGDSLRPEVAFSGETMLALSMNGHTLNRDHGFPIRLLTPRYYGFKSIKWLSTIELRKEPYSGTWTKLGYTKEPEVHTMSHVDRYIRGGGRIRVGGVAFAGVRGIRAVQVRADAGPWVDAQVEEPLSAYSLVRWRAELIDRAAEILEVRAQDGRGAWQMSTERPLFPDGVAGPTRVRLT